MSVENFFENYLTKETLFVNKEALHSNFKPENILFRQEQIGEVANILAPALKLERPSNLFIYGKTGTGKTLSAKHVITSMQSISQANDIPLKCIYINCKLKRVADTEYRLIAQIARECGEQVPTTGLPTDEIYNIFYKLLDEKKQLVLLILDEIDQITKKIGDEVLYNLTRINAELSNAKLAIIGISNSLTFAEHLEPRVKSSLSVEELVFPPYNALQIQDILRKRAEVAFKESAVAPGVIEKCSAYAAREHGDARRAIDLLRIAGEVAERSGVTLLEIKHLDQAEKKMESDKVIHAATGQPKQFQTVLYAIFRLAPQREHLFTGEIYEIYKSLCKRTDQNVLTQRRVSDILSELDMLGLISAKIISKGRYGRTREISLEIDEKIVLKLKELFEKSLGIE